MSARTLSSRLIAAMLAAAALAPSAQADTIVNGPNGPEFTPVPLTHKFSYLGAADGWQERLEAIPGHQFQNAAGQNVDAIQDMAANGCNAIRITVENGQALTTSSFNNSGDIRGRANTYQLDYGGVDKQVDIARRAKLVGMKVVLTIDIGNLIPIGWTSHTYSQVLTDIDTETKRLLDPFLNAGIQPDIIICSNESNGGTVTYSHPDANGSYFDSDGHAYDDRSVGGRKYGGGTYAWSDLIDNNFATGNNTVWPKCAGLYKQAILSARGETTAQGFDVTKTRFGLHSNCGSPAEFFDRIFNPPANQPNFETHYYDPGGVDRGVVTDIPSNLSSVALSSLVDVIGLSYYPLATPSGGLQSNFDNDLNNTNEPQVSDGHGGFYDPNGSESLQHILTDFATYHLADNITDGVYSAGPYAGQFAKKALILEYKSSQFNDSYTTTNSPTRQTNYINYTLNQLANPAYAGFIAGALWWEPTYGEYNYGSGFYLPQNTLPSGGWNSVGLSSLPAWGKYGAPAVINCSFDDIGPSATPSGWIASGANPSASYSENYGAAHSGKLHLTHWSGSGAYSVYTSQTVSYLANGLYTLRAWVRGSGGQSAAYMEAKSFGGTALRANIGVLGNWTQITIPDIQVTNGQCTIGFNSNASVNQWIMADDVTFTPKENVVRNASFDDDNAASATPWAWNTDGPNNSASYTENVGGAHTGSLHLTHWSGSPYTVYTWQTPANLTNGSYRLRAWVKGSGGQTSAYMEAKNFGNPTLRANIGALSNWTQISIPDIQVANNQCTLGFYSSAAANQWIMSDDVEFTKNDNYVLNASFDDTAATATPAGWTAVDANPGASYTENVGGAHNGTLHLTHWSGSPYTVYTYQTATGLQNGTYTLRAWVKGSGGQASAYMEAKDFGNPTLRTNIGALSNWTQISIPNIQVTNGQCTLGFYSSAGANQWIMADDVELIKP